MFKWWKFSFPTFPMIRFIKYRYIIHWSPGKPKKWLGNVFHIISRQPLNRNGVSLKNSTFLSINLQYLFSWKSLSPNVWDLFPIRGVLQTIGKSLAGYKSLFWGVCETKCVPWLWNSPYLDPIFTHSAILLLYWDPYFDDSAIYSPLILTVYI